MGIFSKFRSRDKPANRTAGSGYSFFMGYSSSGKNVTEQTAMQMTAVYACVRILSEAVASLPVHLYRYNDSGGKEKAIDHEQRRSGEAGFQLQTVHVSLRRAEHNYYDFIRKHYQSRKL